MVMEMKPLLNTLMNFCPNDSNFHNQVIASKSRILFEFEPFFWQLM